MGNRQNYPDRSGINRYGEDHIQPDRAQGLDHAIPWSRDPRSESFSEKHHIGKGSKNFSRNDEVLREEVCEAFLQSSVLDPTDIEVAVSEGVVTLSGHVRAREDKFLAEEIAADIPGVKDVMNTLTRGKFDVGDEPGGLIKGIR